MGQIRAVAFDVGNVLIDWCPEVLLDSVATASGLTGERTVEVGTKLFVRSKRRLDLGDLAPREFHVELNAALVDAGGKAIVYEDLRRIWCGAIRSRPGAAALVARVRPEVPFAIWSDTDPIHFGCWSQWLPFLARAKSVWLSFLAGVCKPDPKFYEGAVAALGCRPEEILFVDDTERNVEGARAVGVTAMRVATIADVERVLTEAGSLIG